jgi:membrane protease YdiL (CAAX protease family)
LTSSEPPSDLRPDGPTDGPPEASDGGHRQSDPLVPAAIAAPLTPPGSTAAAAPGVPGRPGTGTFTIEGRAAPGLFVVGWLGTLLGIGMIAIAILSGGGLTATVLLIVGMVLLSVGLIAAAGSQGIERRARAIHPYRGPSPLLVFGASIPLSILAAIVIAIPLQLLGVPLDGPLGALGSVLIQAFIYVGLVRLLVVDTGALSWAEMGISRLPAGRALREMAAGAIWVIPVLFVTGLVAQLLVQVFPVTPTSPLPPTGTTTGLILSLIAGVLVAPAGEEILFRGFATTAWVRGLGRTNGLVLGALFFAFAHVLTVTGTTAGEAFQLAFVAFAGRIPVAIALGWLFLNRGTIWASFGLHATFNGILLIAAEAVSRSVS